MFGSLTFGIRAIKLGVVTRLMAQRQIEERVEGTEKEIMGMKEMLMEMKKTMERMADELRESSNYKKKDESGTSDGLVMKLKGKIEESEVTIDTNQNTIDRSKYKKLEMPMFLGENLEFWVYSAECYEPKVNTLWKNMSVTPSTSSKSTIYPKMRRSKWLWSVLGKMKWIGTDGHIIGKGWSRGKI